MMRRKFKLQSGYGFLLLLLLEFSLLVFVHSEKGEEQKNVSMKRKRSSDSSYYNAYSRPDYNTKSNSNSRQLTSSSTGSSSYYDSQVGEDFGNYAAASHSSGYGHSSGGHGHGGGGYGGGGGGHGGGGGYGHGGGGGHGKGSNVNSSAVGLLGFLALLSLIQKADCNSALGLLGVLGLASYLQNVLRQMTTTAAPTAAPMGRKKRSFNDSLPGVPSSTIDDARITTLVLPMLTAVAHVKDGLVPNECVHRPVCLANKVLVDQLGDQGTSIGNLITNAIGKLLHPFPSSYDSFMDKDYLDVKHKNKKHPSGFASKAKKMSMPTSLASRNREKVIEAGKNGRRKNSKGGECDAYEYCNVLNNLPVYNLPPSGQFV